MKPHYWSKTAGIFMLGVLGINLYIAVADVTLMSRGASHYFFNMLIVLLDGLAASLLLSKSFSARKVVLGGILWPAAYVFSLAFDVFTKLCFAELTSSCWPTQQAAFRYLILNDPNVAGPGFGWSLFPFTIPVALGLLSIIMTLSIITLIMLTKTQKLRKGVQHTPA